MAGSNVCVQRCGSEPWGFRLGGGSDFRDPLTVRKVNPDSPAAVAGLQDGDAILAVSGYDALELTHDQATQLIKRAGGSLQMTIAPDFIQNIRPKGQQKTVNKSTGKASYQPVITPKLYR